MQWQSFLQTSGNYEYQQLLRRATSQADRKTKLWMVLYPMQHKKTELEIVQLYSIASIYNLVVIIKGLFFSAPSHEGSHTFTNSPQRQYKYNTSLRVQPQFEKEFFESHDLG